MINNKLKRIYIFIKNNNETFIKFKMFEVENLIRIIDIINMSKIPEYVNKYLNTQYVNV